MRIGLLPYLEVHVVRGNHKSSTCFDARSASGKGGGTHSCYSGRKRRRCINTQEEDKKSTLKSENNNEVRRRTALYRTCEEHASFRKLRLDAKVTASVNVNTTIRRERLNGKAVDRTHAYEHMSKRIARVALGIDHIAEINKISNYVRATYFLQFPSFIYRLCVDNMSACIKVPGIHGW